MRRFFHMHPTHRKTICFLVALSILTLLGPFGTYNDMIFFERLTFWTVVLVGIGAMVHFCVQLSLNLSPKAKLQRPAWIVLGAIVGAVPGIAIVAFVDRVMRPPGMTLDAARLFQLWWQVGLISIVIALIEYWRLEEPVAGTLGPKEDLPIGAGQTLFHERLPSNGAEPEDIISLSMQDDYVEVTTTTGSHLVLMRLVDAMKELDGLDGLRIHRSHWVALAHIQSLRTKGHRSWLTLSDGRELSVSKSYFADVQAAVASVTA